MDCHELGELVPWYLNGTLPAAQQQQVREHLAGCAACRREAEQARAAMAVFSAHLSAGDLVDLAWGRAPAGLAPGLAERHLGACPACRADLELAQASRRQEQADEGGRARRFALGSPLALAATALLAFLGGGLWQSGRWQARLETLEAGRRESEQRAAELAAELERQRQASAALQSRTSLLGAPQANLPVLELIGESQVQRSAGARANELRLPRDARWVALLLSPTEPQRGAASVQLRAADGRLLWEGRGLLPGPLGAYSLGLPAELLQEGRLTFVLRPDRGRAETYPLLVRIAP